VSWNKCLKYYSKHGANGQREGNEKEDMRHGVVEESLIHVQCRSKKKTANKEKMEQVFIGDIMLKIILRQWLKDSILRSRKLYES